MSETQPRQVADLKWDLSKMDAEDEFGIISLAGMTEPTVADLAPIMTTVRKCAVGGLRGLPRGKQGELIGAFLQAYKDDADPKAPASA